MKLLLEFTSGRYGSKHDYRIYWDDGNLVACERHTKDKWRIYPHSYMREYICLLALQHIAQSTPRQRRCAGSDLGGILLALLGTNPLTGETAKKP